MTTKEIIAQVVALITCAVSCSSYFAKNKILYVVLQLITNVLFAVQYSLLGAISGIVGNVVSVVKYVYIIIKESRGKKINLVEQIIFMVASVICGAFVVKGWIDLIPIVASVLFTYAVCQNDKIVLRVVVMCVCALWTAYGLIVGAYVSAFYAFLEIIFAFATIIKIKRGLKYEKERNSKRQDITARV